MPTDPADAIPYAELVTAFQQTAGSRAELPAAVPALKAERKEPATKLSSPGQTSSPRPTNRPVLPFLLGMVLGSVVTVILGVVGLGIVISLGGRPIASSSPTAVTKVARNDPRPGPVANPPAAQPPDPRHIVPLAGPFPLPPPPPPRALENQPEPGLPHPPETVPFTVDPALEKAKGRVYLSDMQEFAWTPGPPKWTFAKNGDLGNHWPAAPGRIVVKGKEVPKGLSMHPPFTGSTRVRYALGQRAKTLSGSVAISEDDPNLHSPTTFFAILGDGKVLWRSRQVGDKQVVEPFTVEVSGVRILELQTSVENNNANGAHAVWVDPYLLPK